MSQRLTRPSATMTEAAQATLHELGMHLREARQARGEDLYDVANFLRIKPSYLFALEEGDLGLTPGRPYALGFLRSYADYLGFDGGAVVQQVKAALDATSPPPTLHYRTPIAETARPTGVVLGLSIVLAAAIYGVWHIYFRDEPVVERVAAVPGELGRLASNIFELDKAATPARPAAPVSARTDDARPTGTAPTTPATAPELVSPAAPGDPAPTGAPPPRVGPPASVADAGPGATREGLGLPSSSSRTGLPGAQDDLPPLPPIAAAGSATPPLASAAAPTAPALTPSAVPPGGAEPGSARELLAGLRPEGAAAVDVTQAAAATPAPGGTEVRVILVAREPSWIQVRSADREYVRTRTMEAGERYELPNRADLALWTGNAGGLEVLVDGESLGPLGARGRVVRDVALTPEALKARAAAEAR